MPTGPNPPEIPLSAMMIQLTSGHWVSQMMWVVAELGIADELRDGARSIQELSKAVNANQYALYRVLRAVASLGVFEETASGQFAQTPLSELLRSETPGSLRSWARMVAAESNWRVWPSLIHGVRTGESAYEHAMGMPIWEVFAADRELGRLFNESMTGFSAAEIPAVLEAYDFSGIRKLVDVAGGHGTLLRDVLLANPGVHGVLTDLPQVVEGAWRTFEDAGLSARCETVGGDMFESLPAGADAYMMKHIIHDWDDERSIRILSNCRKAMTPDGKVLIIDAVIKPGNEPDPSKLLDIVMLTIQGRERTEGEFRSVLERSGFRLNRIVSTRSPVSVVEGVAA